MGNATKERDFVMPSHKPEKVPFNAEHLFHHSSADVRLPTAREHFPNLN